MIVSAYSDSEKKDKIAEFYDTTYPCSFMRGLLTESQEQERDITITFTARQQGFFIHEEPMSNEEFLEHLKATQIIPVKEE